MGRLNLELHARAIGLLLSLLTYLGEAGLEELLSGTIHNAVDVGATKKSEFKLVIVDATVQEKPLPTQWTAACWRLPGAKW